MMMGEQTPRFSIGGVQNAGPNPGSGGQDDFLKRLEQLLRDVGYGGGLGGLMQSVIGSGILPGRGGDAINGGGSGGGGGGGCLAGDVLVRMADGTEKPASEIKVDDQILGLDFDLGPTPQTVTCTNSSRQMCYLVLTDYASLEASSSHRWFTVDRGLVLTPALEVGTELLGEEMGPVIVREVVEIGVRVVHWWNCDPNHCYFAGGVLHHNIRPDQTKTNPGWSPGPWPSSSGSSSPGGTGSGAG